MIHLQKGNYRITVDCDSSVSWLTYGGGLTDMSQGGYDIYTIWSRAATWNADIPEAVSCEEEGVNE